MKLLKFSLLLVLVSFFAACGEDDSNSNDCVQSDWVDVYAGTVVCDGDSEVATIAITANGSDQLDINYTTPTMAGNYTGVPFSLCDIDEETTINSVETVITGNLDGNDFTFTDVTTGGSDAGTCVISGSK